MTKSHLVTTIFLALLFLSGCAIDRGPDIIEDSSESTLRFGGDLDDSVPLSMKVRQALKQNPQTMHSRILVSTEGDIVRLSGYVNNDAVIAEAERITNQVSGVRFVVNALYLR